MQQTSLSLLERLHRDGDAPSWARLLSIYEPLLNCWLRRQGLQEADVHDLVQDILVIVCQELPQFEHNGRAGAFRNWLRQVMINCLRAHRRRKPADAGAFGALVDNLEDPGSGLGGTWEREHDQFVLCKLTEMIRPEFEPTTWEAFERTVMRAEPTAKVAEALGVSTNAVLVAKSKVLSRLREEKAQFAL
jgi:RNA polymerase sigma-70 factor (ECF subfamily)